MELKTKAAILHDIIQHRLRRRKLQRLLTNDQTVKELLGSSENGLKPPDLICLRKLDDWFSSIPAGKSSDD
jgi:hypothetical protein